MNPPTIDFDKLIIGMLTPQQRAWRAFLKTVHARAMVNIISRRAR